MDGGGGGWGVPPTHMHMHAHAHTHTHAHACMVNMIIPCKWLPPLDLGKSQGFPMMSYVRARACMCGGDPVTTPHPHPPTPQGGGPPEAVKIQ